MGGRRDGITASIASASKMPAAKRGRPAANKVTKPAQKPKRRVSGRLAAAVEEAGSRQVLADRTNEQTTAPPKRGRKAAADKAGESVQPPRSPPVTDQAKTKGTRGRPRAADKAAHPVRQHEEPASARRPDAAATTVAKRAGRPAREEKKEIPETQEEADPMDMDREGDSSREEDRSAMEFAESPAMPGAFPTVATTTSMSRRIGAMTSDSEQNDPSLRRRLGDLSKKYERLESKYRDLRDIGVKEAERNFDRLKRQGEEKTKSWCMLLPIYCSGR